MDNEIYKIFDNTNLLDKFKELELQFQGNICDIYNYALFNKCTTHQIAKRIFWDDMVRNLSSYISDLVMNENGYCIKSDNVCCYDDDVYINLRCC